MRTFSPVDKRYSEFSMPYEPVKMTALNLYRVGMLPFKEWQEDLSEGNLRFKKLFEDRKFLPSVQRIFSDKNLLYVVLYETDPNGRFKVDVFNVQNFELIQSVFFDKVPSAIRNGELYVINISKDETTGGNKLEIERIKNDN